MIDRFIDLRDRYIPCKICGNILQYEFFPTGSVINNFSVMKNDMYVMYCGRISSGCKNPARPDYMGHYDQIWYYDVVNYIFYRKSETFLVGDYYLTNYLLDNKIVFSVADGFGAFEKPTEIINAIADISGESSLKEFIENSRILT